MRFMITLLVVLSAYPAAADIYKCIAADGTVIFTDEGCPPETREVERVPDAAAPEPRELQPPARPLPDRLRQLWSAKGRRLVGSPGGLLALYGLMSILCFVAYWRDRRRAMQRQWRISERTLHLLALAGGWPGGLLAQVVFRHKIRKPAFQAVFWAIVGLHVLLWIDVWRGAALSRAVLQWMQTII